MRTEVITTMMVMLQRKILIAVMVIIGLKSPSVVAGVGGQRR
jgi:hypothetical protein